MGHCAQLTINYYTKGGGFKRRRLHSARATKDQPEAVAGMVVGGGSPELNAEVGLAGGGVCRTGLESFSAIQVERPVR